MKKSIATLLLILTLGQLIAQTEKAAYKAVADKFELNYNKGNYDNIFAMFSPEMKTTMPLAKTTEFFSGLRSQAGQITRREFASSNGTYTSYKTNFQQAVCSLNISIDDKSEITSLFIKPFTDENLPKIERNSTKLKLPFHGEWTVVWGGDTKELNYHVESRAQKNAFDIVITDVKGNSFKTDGKSNEDYYAFGKELIAPCDGEVVEVIDGIKDNKPGEMNAMYAPGNTVIIKTAQGEYLFFGHFKQHSIKVNEGQKVKEGQLLGLCGNSGNSSEPHLHFHIQNTENINVATGVKCYFDKLTVNGEVKTDYSPIKQDKIKSE